MQTDAKSLARTGTEAGSAVPAMHHPNWSGTPGFGTPSHTAGHSSQESGLHPVKYGHAGAARTPSSQSSAPHGPYHGAPYGVPAGGNYGGPNYVGSYAGSQYGSPTPHAGSQPTGSQMAGGYAGAAYGAASYAGSEYRQESAPPPAYGGGLRSDGVSGSDGGMHGGPPMHGSIVDTSAMGSTQPGESGARQVGYAGVPQPVAVGSGSGGGAPLAPLATGEEESTSMLGGPPPMMPPKEAAAPQLDADGRVISTPPPTAPEPLQALASNMHVPAPGEPHTAGVESSTLTQPERGPDLMALGNTQEAQQGPFSAAAARGDGVYVPTAAAATAAADAAAAASAAPASSKGSEANESRSRHDRLATQVFDKTVAPDMDIADFTHEKVVDMLEDVHAEKALFRGKCATSPYPALTSHLVTGVQRSSAEQSAAAPR